MSETFSSGNDSVIVTLCFLDAHCQLGGWQCLWVVSAVLLGQGSAGAHRPHKSCGGCDQVGRHVCSSGISLSLQRSISIKIKPPN